MQNSSSKSDQVKIDGDHRLITKLELATRIRKTPRTVEAWMSAGILPHFKIGRSVLFDWDDVQRHLNKYFHVSGFSSPVLKKGAHRE